VVLLNVQVILLNVQVFWMWHRVVGQTVLDISGYCCVFQTPKMVHPVTQCHIPKDLDLNHKLSSNFTLCVKKLYCNVPHKHTLTNNRRACYHHSLSYERVLIKSLARPGRKQATATKLGSSWAIFFLKIRQKYWGNCFRDIWCK
jgi:hypothetical protein